MIACWSLYGPSMTAPSTAIWPSSASVSMMLTCVCLPGKPSFFTWLNQPFQFQISHPDPWPDFLITAVQIDAFVDDQIALGESPATINRRLSSLHSLFQFLASEHPQQRWPNPVVGRRHHLKTGTHFPRNIPNAEIRKLLDVIHDEQDQAILSLIGHPI